MVLFWRLLLAHLIADFPLQTDAVFAVKKDQRWGVILHATIFGLTAVLLTRPYLNHTEMWLGLVFLWSGHIAIDKTKLVLSGRGGRDHLGYFLIDQALHIGAIALWCLFWKGFPQLRPSSAVSSADARLIQLGIAYVTAIWASPLLAFYLAAAFSRQRLDFKSQQHPLGRVAGYWERGALVAMVIQAGWLLLLMPLVFLPRMSIFWLGKQKGLSRWEFFVGSSLAILMGLWGRTL
jgi:hypothetical protein